MFNKAQAIMLIILLTSSHLRDEIYALTMTTQDDDDAPCLMIACVLEASTEAVSFTDMKLGDIAAQ